MIQKLYSLSLFVETNIRVSLFVQLWAFDAKLFLVIPTNLFFVYIDDWRFIERPRKNDH